MSSPSVFRLFAALLLGAPALASTASLLDGYAAAARKEDPSFTGFSVERGRAFYALERASPDGKATACATCHGADPRQPGRNRNNKVLLPMAPSANPDRVQDSATVEKWFLRNCQDVLQRPCTAREKGDFISYLQSVK